MACRPVDVDVWARSKLPTARQRWAGEVGALVRDWGQRVFPGVPSEVLLGFAANASQNENTTGWITGDQAERATAARTGRRPLGGVASQSFHELGLWGVEGGPATGPAPGADRNQSHNNWAKLHDQADVVALLGRAATMTPGGWRAVRDQTAVGLVNLRNAGRAVLGPLDDAVQPREAGSLWAVSQAFNAWSRGAAGAAASVNRVRAAVAGVPEAQRYGAWLVAVAELVAQGRPLGGGPCGNLNAAYAALRTAQKVRCGELLAADHGVSTAWWSTGLDGATWDRVRGLLLRGAGGASGPARVPATGSSGASGPARAPATGSSGSGLATVGRVALVVVSGLAAVGLGVVLFSGGEG